MIFLGLKTSVMKSERSTKINSERKRKNVVIEMFKNKLCRLELIYEVEGEYNQHIKASRVSIKLAWP